LNKIYHFSHSLTQLQLDDIAAWLDIPSADIKIVEVKVQLDLNKPLRSQCSDIADQVNFAHGEEIYVILPERSDAAVLLIDLLESRGAQVSIVRFGQESTPAGTVFPFKETIRLQNYSLMPTNRTNGGCGCGRASSRG
jgi:hypothetical protein